MLFTPDWLWRGGNSSAGAGSGTGPVDFTFADFTFDSSGSTAFEGFFSGTQLNTDEDNLSSLGSTASTATPAHSPFSVIQTNDPNSTLTALTVTEDNFLVLPPRVALTEVFQSSTDVDAGKDTDITGSAGSYRELVLSKSVDSGKVAEMTAYIFSFENGADTDYLAFGSWFTASDSAYSNALVGAFGGATNVGNVAIDLRPPTDVLTPPLP